MQNRFTLAGNSLLHFLRHAPHSVCVRIAEVQVRHLAPGRLMQDARTVLQFLRADVVEALLQATFLHSSLEEGGTILAGKHRPQLPLRAWQF